ncbi:amino acid adenylation domain-containing protein [Streptomyces sp. SID4919]|uniref:non-ribosomal peptide synthetase n=1 Tax=unclassified Streptomyces TaxID=2593676 RepID=UPI000823C881|nr:MULTISPECIES: non-ribosomal peptide synthetase [unclassified Streptomyces]MYY07954.1 amino acid adenylation domain-containing protein [Streptomyces sp. SID4919]SCK07380.1 amino acid adenylation domain-containing protein [Streptomyces sp. AmelKG-E11A]
MGGQDGAGDGGLGPEQQRLIRLLLEREGAAPAASGVPRRGDDGPAVLSSAQYRMWFHQHAQPDSPAYNLAVAAELTGSLDPAALEAAFAALARRHEVLRTVYLPGPDGTPLQHVLASAPPPFSVVDVTADALDAAASAYAARPFDLAVATPLRLRVYRLAPERHVLLVVLHHIACDDLSWAPLFAGAAAGYRSALRGETPSAEPLPVQYADHAVHEQRREHSGTAFWRERLTPVPVPAAPMPDLPRPARPGPAGARVTRPLPAALHHGLGALARAEAATPFMVAFAGYLVLLHRYTGQSDLAVCTPVVDREDPSLRDLVGNFGNSLVLRAEVSADDDFRTVLRRVKAECLAAYAHQDVPFERVVEAVRPQRSAGRHPLADTMFSRRVAGLGALELPGVEVRERQVHNGTARFDLAVEAVDDGSTTVLGATYRTELYTGRTAGALLAHLETLLAGAVADPGQAVAELPFLLPGERHKVLVEWNDTDRPELLAPATLHGLVEDQVRRSPDAQALVADGVRWSYAELDAAADRLAARLGALGATTGRLVGIHLERSADLVVGLLAVLKSGAAFVPLEPSWPPRRVEEVVKNASPVAVLSRDADGWGPVPAVDPSAEPGGSVPRGPTAAVTADDLAYVIYTSGSTGSPKGAMLGHRGICNRLPWQAELLGLGPGDAVLHKAPLGFDISVNEIFLPLVCGARLVLAPPGADKDPDRLVGLIADEGVSFVYVTSTMLDAMLVRPDTGRAARTLRHVWCGGEVLTPELFDRFRTRLPDSTMYHGYGPAETTIGVSCEVYRGADARTGITIGRPNPNVRMYVLAPGQRPVPPGVPGEIHVGGVQVAEGYLGDPLRTADRFVPDPFGGVPGARLYATGDLGRFRHDGVIEFLGRADHQVKIRGYRIELEEVESVLGRHPAVRQAVVLVREDTPGTQHLAAYCLAAPDRPAPGEQELRVWAAERLPEYAVPHSAQVLAEFPLMPSGKADRAALASLPAAAPVVAPYVRPREGLEQAVAAVWARVLGVPEVGARDNFFDLGGHSLLTLRVQAALEAELGHRVRVVDLFSRPTVADLAALLAAACDDTGPGGVDRAVRERDEELARRRRAARSAGAARRTRAREGRSDD